MKNSIIGLLATTAAVSLIATACSSSSSNDSSTKTTQTTKKKETKKATASNISWTGNTVEMRDLKIKITGVKFYKGYDAKEKNVIAFDVEVTNKSSKKIDSVTALTYCFKAYQDNPNTDGELEVGALPTDTPEQVSNDQTKVIKKGGTVKGRMAFELDSNTKPVTLKAFRGLDGDLIGKRTYKIGTFQAQNPDAVQ